MKILCSMNKMQRSFLGNLGKKLSAQVVPVPAPAPAPVSVSAVQEAEIVTETVTIVEVPVVVEEVPVVVEEVPVVAVVEEVTPAPSGE
jgi:hypothetical protein